MTETRTVQVEACIPPSTVAEFVTFSVTWTPEHSEVVIEWAGWANLKHRAETFPVDAMNQDRCLLGRLAGELERADACYSDWEEFH